MADSRLAQPWNPHARNPRPDFGAGSTFYRGIGIGVETSLAGTAVRAGKYFLADALDGDAITKEAFDAEFGITGGPQWQQGMSRSRAALMYDDWMDDRVSEYEVNPRYFKSMLAGGFIGQALDPSNYIGLGAASVGGRMAAGGGRMATLGRGLQNLNKVINPEVMAIESRLATAGERALGRAANVFASGAMEGGLQTAGIYGLTRYTQQGYSNEDALADFTGAFAISALLGVGASTFKHLKRSQKDLITDAVLDGAVNGVDKTDAVKSILSTDPVMNDLLAKKEARAAKVARGEQLSPQDIVEMSSDEYRQFFVDAEGKMSDEDIKRFNEEMGEGNFGVAMDRLEQPSTEPRPPRGEFQSEHVRAYEMNRAVLERSEANRLRRQMIEKNSQTADQRRAAGTMTDDEGWISDLYSKAFGADVRFFDEATSKQARALGFYGGRDRTIYIRSGNLFGSIDSMMSIAGHEVSHSFSKTSPKVWLDMADAIVATGAQNASVRSAYTRTRAALSKEGNSIWSALPDGTKMDEMFATVSGSAMQTPEFWRSMWTNSPTSAAALKAGLTLRADAFKKRGGTKGATMAAELGRIVALAGNDRTPVDLKDLKIKGGYARYGARHLDFMHAVAQDLRKTSYRALLGDKADITMADMDGAIREMVTFQEDGATLTERSGTPETRGQYDIRPFRFTAPAGSNWKSVVSHGILNLVFSKAKDGTPERALFERWKKGNGSGAYEALRDYLKGDRNSLLQVIDHKDGTYSVGVLRNDERPWITFTDEMSTELETLARAPLDATLDRAALNQSVTQVRQTLTDMLAVMREEGPVAGRIKLAAWGKNHDENLRNRGVEDPFVEEFFNSPEALDVIDEWNRVSTLADKNQTIFDAFLGAFEEFTAKRLERALANNDKTGHATLSDHLDTIDVMQKLERDPQWKKRKDFTPTPETFRAAQAKQTQANYERAMKQLGDERDPATFLKDARAMIETVREEMRHELALKYLMATDLGAAADANPSSAAINRAWKEIKERAPWIEQELAEAAEARIAEQFPGYNRLASLEAKNDRFFSQNIDSWNDPANARLAEHVMGGGDDELPIRASDAPDDEPVTFMARLADEDAETAARRAEAEAARQEAAPVMAAAEASKRIADLSARERTFFSGWSQGDITTKAFPEIKRLATEAGIEGFDPATDIIKLNESFATQEGKLSLKQQQMRSALMGILATMSKEQGDLLLYANGRRDLAGTYAAQRFDFHMHRLDKNVQAAGDAARADILRESSAKMISMLRDDSAIARLQTMTKQGMEQVKNFLDGLAYKGTLATGDNLANSRIIARESAQAKFITLLEDINREPDTIGFKDQWLRNQHTRNIELHRHGEYKGPDHVKKVYDRIIKRLDEVNETLVGEANSLGANIRLLDRYLWSQVHRAEHLRQAGREAYIADLKNMIDEKATRKLHEPGWEFRPWAEAFYDEMTDRTREIRNDFDPDAVGNNMADPEGLRRTIIFKPGSAFDYDMKYGSGHTAGLITGQIGSRGEKLGLMRKMGTNYNANWGSYIAGLGGNGPAFSDLRTADLTYRHIAGQLDHPYDAKLATYGRAVRNWMNAAMGWMAGVSSITDTGNLVSQLRFMGGEEALKYRSVMRSLLSSMSSDTERATWMRGNSAGLQALVQSYSRVLESDGWFVKTGQWLSDTTFKYNGLEVMNRSVQGAFLDISSQILGDNVRKQSPEFSHWLKSNGISEAAWAKMSTYAGKIDGLDNVRLSPDMIPDVALSRQLAEAMRASMDYALLQPSASTEALLRMGTQAGTWTGEAVRSAIQFKAYPVDMVRRVVRRFNNGYAKNAHMERLIWASTMVGLSVTALSIKDMWRGTEPLNPLDAEQWNWHNVLRVAEQATVGPFAMLGQLGSAEQALGPTVGSIYGAFAADTTYGRTAAVLDLTPGATAWTGPRRALMSTVMPETFGGPIEAMYAWRQMETGQGRLLRND